MPEFRISPDTAADRRRDRTIRLFLWGAVLALLGVACFGVLASRSATSQTNTAVAALTCVIVVGVVAGAYYFAIRFGPEKLKRSMVFDLTATELVARRSGRPDVRIGLSELKALYERPGWLVVRSEPPLRTIVIPQEINGFTSLRAELTKHAAIVAPPRLSPLAFVPMVAAWTCWALVLFSKDVDIIKVASLIALTFTAWCSFLLVRLLRQSSKRVVLWFWLGFNWVALLWVVYSRLTRF